MRRPSGKPIRVPVPSLRFFRGQASEDRRFALVQVRQIQHVLRGRLTVAGVFAAFHELGPHVPAMEYVGGLMALNWEPEMEAMILSANEESLIKVVRMLPPDEAKK